MNRSAGLLTLIVLGGPGLGIDPPALAQQASQQRRSSAIPGRVFPNELAAQAQAIQPTAHPAVGSILKVQPFLLDVPEAADPYGRRPTAPGATAARPFQNANPQRITAGFNRGNGLASREQQLQAQTLGVQRGQSYHAQGQSQYPISFGFPIGNGGTGLPGGGTFALIGVR